MRKRNCRVEIYFTKDELESLTKKVRKSGLSRESFCRHLLNGAEIKEAPSADVPLWCTGPHTQTPPWPVVADGWDGASDVRHCPLPCRAPL